MVILPLHDLSMHPTETGQKPHLFSTQPFLGEAVDRLEFWILVHQHRPFLPGGGGNPGIGHREGMAGLDGGHMLRTRFVIAQGQQRWPQAPPSARGR